MRTKRNKNSRDRLEKVCSGPVFQHLSKYDPNFMERIKIVAGDLNEGHLGIPENAAILSELIENVEIVIHAAADVRLNESLYNLIWPNLVGTRDLLEIAKQMRKLQVFVYMSTAFSNTKVDSHLHIAEKFYEPPMNADTLIDYVQMNRSDTDKCLLDMLAPILIQPWPNNYTFSKALSESVVRRYEKHFPIAVVRPSISECFFLSNRKIPSHPKGLGYSDERILVFVITLYSIVLTVLCCSFVVISTYADPIMAWSNSYGGNVVSQILCSLDFCVKFFYFV